MASADSRKEYAQLPLVEPDQPSNTAKTVGVPDNGLTCCFAVLSILTVGSLPLIVLLIWVCCSQSFQLWALQRPDNVIVRILYPMLLLLESLGFGGGEQPIIPTWKKAYKQWGNNFCATGQVYLGSMADVSKIVAGPQARAYRLGEHPLLPSSLPDIATSRCVFLLALSNKGAGGLGMHEAIRDCLDAYLFKTEAFEERKTDAYAEGLFVGVTEEYKALQDKSKFFSDQTIGIKRFMTKYIHYVMYGLKSETTDPADWDVLTKFFQGETPLMYYLWPFGVPDLSKSINTIAKIYGESVALKDFRESAAHWNLTKRELTTLMCSIMRIAGIQGTTVQAAVILTMWNEFWDKLDLENELDLERFIRECGRLAGAVTVSNHVATADFTCKIAGSDYTFPKGTNIAIPLMIAQIDPDYWGPDAEQFNYKREKLLEGSLLFNAFNGQGMRWCPGTALAMYTMKQLLKRLGKARRGT
jgi:hypothetical protein